MAPTETEGGVPCLKTPRKSFPSIKAPPCPLVILFCIIRTLQLSAAIRPPFFMQINLTAQQSVGYASPRSLVLSFLLLRSLALSLHATSLLLAFAAVATFALFIIAVQNMHSSRLEHVLISAALHMLSTKGSHCLSHAPVHLKGCPKIKQGSC